MKKIILLLIVTVLSISCNKEKQTKIYFVRHAEKVLSDPNNNNPELTAEGAQRAVNLSKIFEKIPLDAVFSTDFIRTKATVNPTAKTQNLKVQFYNDKDLKNEATQILNSNKAKTVLIAGHSNTLLEMIEAMGAKRPIEKIEDTDYDNLFLVTINTDGTSEVTTSQFSNSK